MSQGHVSTVFELEQQYGSIVRGMMAAKKAVSLVSNAQQGVRCLSA